MFRRRDIARVSECHRRTAEPSQFCLIPKPAPFHLAYSAMKLDQVVRLRRSGLSVDQHGFHQLLNALLRVKAAGVMIRRGARPTFALSAGEVGVGFFEPFADGCVHKGSFRDPLPRESLDPIHGSACGRPPGEPPARQRSTENPPSKEFPWTCQSCCRRTARSPTDQCPNRASALRMRETRRI